MGRMIVLAVVISALKQKAPGKNIEQNAYFVFV
jgi:hypothetical protein